MRFASYFVALLATAFACCHALADFAVGCNGPSPMLQFSPESLDSRQQVVVTVGRQFYLPKSVSVVVANGQINITYYAGPWLNGPQPPQSCMATVIGPFDAGLYTVNLWLVDLPDFPAPQLLKQTTLDVQPAPKGVNGLWWNPSESGWGMSLIQRGNILFGVWFTYDTNGDPRWYVAPRCELPSTVLTGASCTDILYKAQGGAIVSKQFEPKDVAVSPQGRLTLNFQNENFGGLSFILDGVVRTVNLARQPISSGQIIDRDYTDLWWNPNESGWGLSIAQQGGVMFLTWFVYDEDGKAKWYFASNCAISAAGNGCSGTLYEAKGPPFGVQFDSTKVSVFAVGDISIKFRDANIGDLSYSIKGVTGTKVVSRQLF